MSINSQQYEFWANEVNRYHGQVDALRGIAETGGKIVGGSIVAAIGFAEHSMRFAMKQLVRVANPHAVGHAF